MIRKFAVAILATLLLPALAHAQSNAAEQEAQERFKEGKALYAQNKIEEARLKFVQACAVLKDDVCIRNLAVAEFYSNHAVDAYRNITGLLARGTLKSEPEVQHEFERMQQKAYGKTCHIDVQAPPGGQVRIDDAIDAGNAPLKELIHVSEGRHVVSVQVETQIEREEIDCAAGKVVKVDFNRKFNFVIGPPGGEEKKKMFPPPDTEPKTKMFPPPIGAIVVMGVGLVGIGLGVGFAVDSTGKDSDARKLGPCAGANDPACAKARELRDSQNTSASIATASIVIGSVMVAGGLAWWLIAPRKARQSGFVPSISPQFVGATYSHSF